MAKFTAAIALLLLPVVFAQELPVPDVPLSALSRDSPVKFVKPSLSPVGPSWLRIKAITHCCL